MGTEEAVLQNKREYVDWDSIKYHLNIDENESFVNPFFDKTENNRINEEWDKKLSSSELAYISFKLEEREKQKTRHILETPVLSNNPYENYEEQLKIRNFRPFFGSGNDEEQGNNSEFKEFMELSEIMISNLPSDVQIIHTQEIDEVLEKKTTTNTGAKVINRNNHQASVNINKNADDDVESIEITCSCGEKTIINLKV